MVVMGLFLGFVQISSVITGGAVDRQTGAGSSAWLCDGLLRLLRGFGYYAHISVGRMVV